MPHSHSCAVSTDTPSVGNEMPASMILWGRAAGPLSWSVGMTVEYSESFLHVFEVLSGHSEASSSSRSRQICGRASPGLQDSVSVGLSPLVCAQGGCDLLTPPAHTQQTPGCFQHSVKVRPAWKSEATRVSWHQGSKVFTETSASFQLSILKN